MQCILHQAKHLQARRSLFEYLQIAPLCTKIAPSIAPTNRHGDHLKTLRIVARPGQGLLVRNTFNTRTASRRWTASEESHGHGKVDGRLLARAAIRCQLEKAINSDAPAALIGQLKACCATLEPRRDARTSARRTCLIAGIGDSKANPPASVPREMHGSDKHFGRYRRERSHHPGSSPKLRGGSTDCTECPGSLGSDDSVDRCITVDNAIGRPRSLTSTARCLSRRNASPLETPKTRPRQRNLTSPISTMSPVRHAPQGTDPRWPASAIMGSK